MKVHAWTIFIRSNFVHEYSIVQKFVVSVLLHHRWLIWKVLILSFSSNIFAAFRALLLLNVAHVWILDPTKYFIMHSPMQSIFFSSIFDEHRFVLQKAIKKIYRLFKWSEIFKHKEMEHVYFLFLRHLSFSQRDPNRLSATLLRELIIGLFLQEYLRSQLLCRERAVVIALQGLLGMVVSFRRLWVRLRDRLW